MKRIRTGGITCLQPLEGSARWLWGCDYASGDCYEAEEAYRAGRKILPDRVILVSQPDGRVYEPVTAKEGQYLAPPAFWAGQVAFLLADFSAARLKLLLWGGEGVETLADLPLSLAEDCYNLLLKTAPLMLTRQGSEGKLQILWPEEKELPLAPNESFSHREGDRLWFSRWQEDPDYREETVIRSFETGETLEILSGALCTLPDGQTWILE